MPLPSRDNIAELYLADEAKLVTSLAAKARLSHQETVKTDELARRLVEAAREGRRKYGGVDAFMTEYGLSTEEGVVLMCLAEALLRIPDAETADKLIADKIGGKAWANHLGHSESLFVNASTWGLMLTGQVVRLDDTAAQDATGYLKRLITRSGEPIIRQAMRHAMRIMGRQFVLGRTIEEALEVAADREAEGYRFSFDMLGEAAMTEPDAQRYLASYENALKVVAAHAKTAYADASIFEQPSISVKLSALHPRYEAKKPDRVIGELLPRVRDLALAAKGHGLGLTIDAEEADRLDISLDLFGQLLSDKVLGNWDGLGLAVQAYGRRAYAVLEWLEEAARQTGRKIPVRLVKGAYWDTEVKRAQENGLASYPVFTRKVSTDVSYLACARFLLNHRNRFYPQFATHNAHTIAAVHAMAGNAGGYEFQRLHGMGQALYEDVVPQDKLGIPCRIYAPVGSHEDLLAYLVRRLLENGANTSFVNRLADDEAPIDDIIANPMDEVAQLKSIPHERIPAPADIFGTDRKNSAGFLHWEERVRGPLTAAMKDALNGKLSAAPLVSGKELKGSAQPVNAPHDRRITVGHVVEADAAAVDQALAAAKTAEHEWNRRGGAARADLLDKVADLYEKETPLLLGLLVQEAGKTLENAIADLREAVDFLRYYAVQARMHFAGPKRMDGPTGERNELFLGGRGTFACISPWNFPLAIFTGQVAAALAAGNCVIAKPAEQTPLVAAAATRLFHKAGIPGSVMQFLPGRGEIVGARLIADQRIAGVCFTGSNETAGIIQRSLAAREGAIVPFVAETGGINAMIVDSSALPEQTVRDTVRSAFDSAGQRCSALRLLMVQDDVADKVIKMLIGAMAELKPGDPMDYSTDIGPVIDEEARKGLEAHKAQMKKEAKLLYEGPLPPETSSGTFVAPTAFEISDPGVLKREVFGPILHVVRYKASQLDKICAAINATGYGLTLGIHSRIDSTIHEIIEQVHVGNIYVNRNQIGAVVGAQPFGGEGLSGTGPKAGGPHYLFRFATERVISTDTTASGGNAALMSMEAG